MRRKDRQMPKEFALQVVDKCQYATLAMTNDDKPYCVPLSIVRIDDHIYFHSATEGQKTDFLKKNPHVCLSCVGDINLVPSEFTTEYECAIVKGMAFEVVDDHEKIAVLRHICEKYALSNMAGFDKAIQMSLSRTAIWKISIDEITGKRKKYDKDGVEMKFGRME